MSLLENQTTTRNTRNNKKDSANASNLVGLEEIKNMLSELSDKLTQMDEKFEKITEELKQSISKADNKAEEALKLARENKTELEGLKMQLELQNNKIEEQDDYIQELEDELDDMKNRSMRKTLIFKNVTKSKTSPEKNWNDTKNLLVNEIMKVLPSESRTEIYKNIERAHRSSSEANFNRDSPSPIIAKFNDWNVSENIKAAFIKANQTKQSSIFVDQMYSKALTARRNEALKLRAKIKSEYPDIQGYVKYPAILMIKRRGERKYSTEKEF